MAQPTQDGIKEKVQSVREVVPGHSNNEITLVLQYYDYSVEHAIQAYLEDGAKEALKEWHFPGNKDKEKKKKLRKKKAKEQKEKEAREAEEAQLKAAAEAAAAASLDDVLLNGDIHSDNLLTNGASLSQATSEGSLNEVGELLAPPSGATSLPGAPSSNVDASCAFPSTSNANTVALETISHNQTSDIRVTPSSSSGSVHHEALPQRSRGGGGNRDRGPKGRAPASSAQDPGLTVPPSASAAAGATPLTAASSRTESSTATSSASATLSSSASVPSSAIASSHTESSQQSSTASQSSKSPATSSVPSAAVSTGHAAATATSGVVVRPTSQQQKYQQRPKGFDNRKLGDQQRTGQTSSSGAGKDKPAPAVNLNAKRPFAGLEKSLKDLHRQTLALTRIKMMLSDEMDRCYKKITEVFEDFHTAMNEREADVIYEMDKVKDEAHKTLTDRQKRAAELKKRTERAAAMNDSEVAELRHDIKVFVSDRKIDEELGSTQRFQCAAEELMRSIRSFGEVVGVRSTYGQRRNSVSSVSSSCVSHDDLMSPTTPLTPLTPGTPLSAHIYPVNSMNPPLPRVMPTKVEEPQPTKPDPPPEKDTFTKEIEEMQQKFQAAFKAPSAVMKLNSAASSTGVSSMAETPLSTLSLADTGSVQSLNTSVDSSTASSPQSPQNTPGDYNSTKKSRTARRRIQQRERDRKIRAEYHHNSGNNQDKKAAPAGSSGDSKPPTHPQPKARSVTPSAVDKHEKSVSIQEDATKDAASKNTTSDFKKPRNEQRSQSQPARIFEARRDRSASARGRPQQGGGGGRFNRGPSPSRRGGRPYRGAYQGPRQGAGNHNNNQGYQQQEYRGNNPRGPRPEGQGSRNQSHDGRGPQNRNSSRGRGARFLPRDSVSSRSYNNRSGPAHHAKSSSESDSNTKDVHESKQTEKESTPPVKKELESVPENKKETGRVSRQDKKTAVDTKDQSNVDKKSSVPPVSALQTDSEPNPAKNSGSLSNNNKGEQRHNSTSSSNGDGSPKVDENSNHKKSSGSGRLTNGNVPHEVSINDAPIVKKSVVSVEEVTRNQELGLPQRKPRKNREVKRAEVIVNGDLQVVNGHLEE